MTLLTLIKAIENYRIFNTPTHVFFTKKWCNKNMKRQFQKCSPLNQTISICIFVRKIGT